jgi:Flp pilus assembly protein TadD
VLALYEPVADHAFLEYDDGLYVTDNVHVRAGLTLDTARWALWSLEIGNWHPLTWWSHALAVEWFGLDAGAHHRVSVVLHAMLSAVLLMTLFVATGSLWRSALVAALFAVHPMRIESVAWIAERKDVLFGLFFVLTIAAHTAYARRPGALRYALVLLAGAAALMSKAMAVTLPAVLLLLDYWPLQRGRRFGWLVFEKLPLIALCGLVGALALSAQAAGGAITSLDGWPLPRRAANALVAYAAYLGSSFWPSGLAVFYPHPRTGHGLGVLVGSTLAVTAVAALALSQLRRRPAIAVGLLWFFGTLVPVIGLVAVGEQARSDRYSYLPSIGLAIALVWSLPESWIRRPAVWGSLLMGTAALAATTWQLLPHWRNDETLFARALAVTVDSRVAHLNYGNAIDGQGRLDEQRFHFERAIELRPGDALAHYDLARVLAETGDDAGGVQEYRRALALDPEDPRAWNNLGSALSRLGKPELAERAYRQALVLAPDHASALINLAMRLLARGELDEGARLGERYFELRPADQASRASFAVSLAERARSAAAIDALASAPSLDASGLGLLASLEWARGSEAAAIDAGERALALEPASAERLNDLAWMLATCHDDRLRDPPRALELAQVGNAAARRRDPDLLDTLAVAQAAGGDFAAAVVTVGEALDRARDRGRLDLIPIFEQRAARFRSREPQRRKAIVSGSGA